MTDEQAGRLTDTHARSSVMLPCVHRGFILRGDNRNMSGLSAHLLLKMDNNSELCCTIYGGMLTLRERKKERKKNRYEICFESGLVFFCAGGCKLEGWCIKKKKKKENILNNRMFCQGSFKFVHLSHPSFTPFVILAPSLSVT